MGLARGRATARASLLRARLTGPIEAAQGLLEIARTAKRDADRIAAWKELVDRGWGKAAAFAGIEGADPLGMGEVEAEIRRIAEELQRQRPAS